GRSHLLRRRDRRQGRAPADVPPGRAQHDDPGVLAGAAGDRDAHQRRRERARGGPQQHRAALQRRDGPVGLRQRRVEQPGRRRRRGGAAARPYALARPCPAVVLHRAGEGPGAGPRGRAGRCHRWRRRPRHRVRPALRHRGRVLLRAGDQHRHDGGRRHAAAAGQGGARGLRPRDGLHGSARPGPSGVRGRSRAGGLRRPRVARRRRAADRPRDRRPLAARGVGHQGRAELRPRPPGRRRARADRDLAGRHVPAGRHGRGLHGQGREAPARLPRAAPRAARAV
ncbi:MAG: Enoyl-CoA hydratase, partial [uncultured Frankineae bacterium]